jgi:hypothetical protein
MYKLFIVSFFIAFNFYADGVNCLETLHLKTKDKTELKNADKDDLKEDIKTVSEYYQTCAIDVFKKAIRTSDPTTGISSNSIGTNFLTNIEIALDASLKANAYFHKLNNKVKDGKDFKFKDEKENLKNLIDKSKNLSKLILADFYTAKANDEKNSNDYIDDLNVDAILNDNKNLKTEENSLLKDIDGTKEKTPKSLLTEVFNMSNPQQKPDNFQKEYDVLDKKFNDQDFHAYKKAEDPANKNITDEKDEEDNKDKEEDKAKDEKTEEDKKIEELEEKLKELEENNKKTEEEKEKEKKELEEKIKELEDSKDDKKSDNLVVTPNSTSSGNASGSPSGGRYGGSGGLPSLSYQKARERYDKLREKRERELKNKEIDKLTGLSRGARIAGLKRGGLQYKRESKRRPYSNVRKPSFKRGNRKANDRPKALATRYPSTRGSKDIDYSKYYGTNEYSPVGKSNLEDLFGTTYNTAKRRALLQDAGTGEFASRNIDPFLLNSIHIYEKYFKGEIKNKNIIPME